MPENHVLTKSFYLMRSFPGRFDGGSLWVEAEPEDEAERSERSRRTDDGVSSIVITSNDLACAWAIDEAAGRSIRRCPAARFSARWPSEPASTS